MPALAMKELERDATPAASLRVSCAACDPDNPRAVPRLGCRRCGGSGFVVSEVASIAAEIRRARIELLEDRGPRRREDEDD